MSCHCISVFHEKSVHDAISSTWFAELMRHLIGKLEDKAFQAIFKPGVLDGALAEASELEPHLKVLDQGKKTKAYNATFKNHGQALASNKTGTRDDVQASGEFLHQWAVVLARFTHSSSKRQFQGIAEIVANV